MAFSPESFLSDEAANAFHALTKDMIGQTITSPKSPEPFKVTDKAAAVTTLAFLFPQYGGTLNTSETNVEVIEAIRDDMTFAPLKDTGRHRRP